MTDFATLKQMWPMPSAPRPIVLIGAGAIVRDAHLPGYARHGLPVAGIYDIDRPRAEALAERFGVGRVFATLAEAMAAGSEVVFDIALPPQALRDVLPTLPRGAAALIQKPLGMSAGEAHELAAILSARQVTAAVNFQMRLTPAMVAVEEAVKRGLFGTVTEVEVRLACRTPWEDWPFMATLDHIELPLHSIHYLDWIRAVIGMPQAVYARALPHPDNPDRADARSSIILDYGDTVRCCLTLNHTHKWGPRHESCEFRVEGTEGAAVVGLGYMYDQPKGRPETLEMIQVGEDWQAVPLAGARVPDSFAAVMANLQRFAAGEDSRLLTDIGESVATMELVEACMRSSDTGQVVKMAADAKGEI